MKMDETIQHYKLPKNSLDIDHLTIWMLPLEYFETVNGQLSSDIKVRWHHNIHITLSRFKQQSIELDSGQVSFRVNGIVYDQIDIPGRKP